ncbi:hypothetical protein [Clostridium sp. B9]|uniref:hypothetical protein n=1 Tax=Clostridium sp. B9 TaxID=3423224 RepID=UPI003D2F4B4A
MNKCSCGILMRPENADTLVIILKNANPCLSFQTISIYDWDTGSPVLVHLQNYFIPGNGTNTIEFPLIYNGYDCSYIIDKYEVKTDPQIKGITVKISTK